MAEAYKEPAGAIDPADALAKVAKAIKKGTGAFDVLPDDVKEAAKQAAYDTLIAGPDDMARGTSADIGADDASEGYNVIPEVEPPRKPSKEYQGREDYKGFKMPKGLTGEKEAAWKAEIDASFTSQVPETVGALGAKALGEPGGMVPPTTGDPARDPDAGRALLTAGSMLPVGQAAQAGADAGVMGLDIAEDDYTGAAISGASVLLPFVSAGALKALLREMPKSNRAGGLAGLDAMAVVEKAGGGKAEMEAIAELNNLEKKIFSKSMSFSEARMHARNIDREYLEAISGRRKGAEKAPQGTRFVEQAHDVSPKFGLEDMGGLKFGLRKAGEPVPQFGPLTVNDVDQLQRGEVETRGLREAELRQLRDEYVAYGYDDFESLSHRSDALGPDGKPINLQYALASRDEIGALINQPD
jgi:hypothetical protein|tara:strand:+ start:1213 stop:2454 length:1242 start_codon:yes stop_codon:yes gene_type:complete